MKKFNFDVYSSEINDYKDYEFEIQVMDNFIFNDTINKYNVADMRSLAKSLLQDMVVSPSGANELKFWREDFEGLQVFLQELIKFQESFMIRSKKRKGFREIKQS